MQTPSAFWDGVAKKYAKSPIRDVAAYEYTLGRTRSYLKSTDQVLELGCGTGSTALLLAKSAGHITATDVSQNMLDVARDKKGDADNVSFQRCDAARAPERPFDVVMAFNLLHLLEDVDAALAEVHRRVKPGGLFISKTPCTPGAGAPLKFRLILMLLPLLQFFGKAPFVNFMSEAEWENSITAAGFDIIETGNHPVKPPARYIVARRK